MSPKSLVCLSLQISCPIVRLTSSFLPIDFVLIRSFTNPLSRSECFLRERADAVLSEGTSEDPSIESIDKSVSSVGRAMGASDFDSTTNAGGVDASPEAVIANYFLKSHGGAHLLQTACSVMAQMFAMGSIFVTVKYSSKDAGSAIGNAKWTLAFLRSTMVFAMVKHISGLIASASLAAKAIPKIGISQSRKWMEDIVREPVAQYVFYSALILLWLPLKAFQDADGSVSTMWWWPKQRFIVSLLVAPILLREFVSNVLVVYDMAVLWSVSSKDDNAILEKALQYSQSIVNAVMSLVVSPEKWRSADSAGRQEILAGLVSKNSLFAECGVGSVLVIDSVVGLLRLMFGILGGRPAWHEMLLKLVIIRLYVHFLVWTRRKNISKLVTEMRGGAAQFPFWLLDSLYDPAKALGISKTKVPAEGDEEEKEMSWKDTLTVGLGLNDAAKTSKKK